MFNTGNWTATSLICFIKIPLSPEHLVRKQTNKQTNSHASCLTNDEFTLMSVKADYFPLSVLFKNTDCLQIMCSTETE